MSNITIKVLIAAPKMLIASLWRRQQRYVCRRRFDGLARTGQWVRQRLTFAGLPAPNLVDQRRADHARAESKKMLFVLDPNTTSRKKAKCSLMDEIGLLDGEPRTAAQGSTRDLPELGIVARKQLMDHGNLRVAAFINKPPAD